MTRRLRGAVALLAVAVLLGCTATSEAGPGGPPAAPSAVPAPRPPDVDLTILPARQVAPTPGMRLAEGLSPPTNRWFSALALGDAPQPVFPLPLAVALTATGFGVGVPQVTTTATGVFGPYAPQLTVDVGGRDPEVSAYDAASVTMDLGTGALTVVEGSPVLHWTAANPGAARFDTPFEPGGPAGSAVAAVGGRTWLLLATDPDGAPAAPALAADGRSADVPAGGGLAWLALPDGVAAGSAAARTLADAAAHPPAPTTLRWAVSAGTATTELDLGAPTAVVRLPHQATLAPADDLDCDGLGAYATVLGAATACAGRTAAWSVPAVAVDATLDVAALPEAERAELADAVTADTERLAGDAAPAYPADTYFGGKALARDAHLLTLATALGLDEPAARLRERLGAELRLRAEPDGCARRAERCFVLDPVLATVVGLPAGFGSEEGNDHHFHDGYLLEAAALAAADDAAHGDGTLAAALAPVADLLAADVAAAGPVPAGDGPAIPALRTFDAFAGHSWASGYAPFADGNNQESSSEAVAAWHGLALWASVRDDAALGDEARWLLASEAASARAYWLEPDGGPTSFASLVWGGKRERATWFSPAPSAALGIQVLPVTPSSGYLAGPEGTPPDGGARVRANLAEALGVAPADLWADPSAWDIPFGDQLLAYAALAGPDDAAHAAALLRELPDERIDDGSTRAWLLAWAMTRAAGG
ncbi:glycosyl hydrolase [Xylanimonas protaetiae]|uniref:glucan endo-1,3-beta-D-glucosidase n=1 Tax=Xylanimonas protaetiae TaxID=2509457 RepID=A0A4P6F3B4_9MICO|nr:glycosyl hydrolase [Xylanimonas protaetiae]QAY69776.1 1,3-beta-glucanase [Xylanimonas protaetiae]